MIDKWSAKFKKGATINTRKVGRVYICKNCGRKLPLLSLSHFYCNPRCQREYSAKQKLSKV